MQPTARHLRRARHWYTRTLACLGTVLATFVTGCGDDTIVAPTQELFLAPPVMSAVELLVQIDNGEIDPGADGEYISGEVPEFDLVLPPVTVLQPFSQEIELPGDPQGGTGAVNWGDGTGNQSVSLHGPVFGFVNGEVVIVGPAGFTLSHTYASPGLYTVRVAVETAGGARVKTTTIQVNHEPFEIQDIDFPTTGVSFETSSFSLRAPVSVTPGPYSVSWTFDDANGANQTASVAPGGTVSFTRTWDAPGARTVNVTLRSPLGTVRTVEHTVTVADVVRFPVFDIPTVSYAHEDLSYTYTVTHPDGLGLVIAQSLYKGSIATGNKLRSNIPSGTSPLTVTNSYPSSFFDAGETYYIVIRVDPQGLDVTRTVEVEILDSPHEFSCEAGTYWGGTECVPAPVGHYVPNAAAQAATECAVGTYQDQVGQTSCLPALPGSYVDVTGAAQATPCPVTQVQPEPASASCHPTPPGTYAPEEGLLWPYFCVPGTYQPNEGSASCLDADPGHFAWGIEPDDPDWGHIFEDFPDLQLGGFAWAQEPCAIGTYQPDSGQPACLPAPLGTYVDQEGAALATPCPAWGVTLEVGSTSSADCLPAGHTRAGSGVAVTPLDDTTGEPAAVTLTFDNVTSGGLTTVTSGGMGEADAPPTPSSQFRLGSPATYWEVNTEATFSGAIEICISLAAGAFLDPSAVRLLHDDGSGWVDVTTSADAAAGIVCGSVTSLSPFVLVEPNHAPTLSLGGPHDGSEGSPIVGFAVDAHDADGDAVSVLAWDFGDGRTGSGTPPVLVYEDEGAFTVSVTVADALGAETTATTSVNVANVAPELTALTAPLEPVAVGAHARVDLSFTDPGTLDTHTVTVYWGDGTSSAATLGPDGRSASPSHAYSTPGVYTVRVTVDDGDGGVDAAEHQYVVVYDGSAGFVTGGGWIESPPGACTLAGCQTATTGAATFGFVARYQKGANRPSGNTAFEFEAGGLAFESVAYEWLVVAGTRAQFKGTGRINDAGDYGFLLTAIDGEGTGADKGDRFRIKIWDRASGDVVYDNQRAAEDDSEATTELGGGSIRIHAR